MKKNVVMAHILGLAGAACLFTALHAAKEASVGKPAPDFTLTDAGGAKRSLSDHKGKYVVLEWVNHGCPFVKKHYDSGNMQSLQKELTGKDVVWLSICSSAKGKQGHYSAGEWKKVAQEKGMASTAVLLDEGGTVGKTYGAKTTPHMYVVNPEGVLIYKGAIDDRPTADAADVKGAHNYVRAAVEESMSGKKVAAANTTPYGCSVKYQ
jgi:peroxiredoxin